MKHARLTYIAIAVLLCSWVAAETPLKKIAVIPKGTTHEFWKAIHAGALKAGAELGAEIIWKGPHREDDREQQVQVVENFLSKRVDGIVLAPLDDRALKIPVRDATRANIPVVIIDSAMQGEDFISFVATDNYQGGKLAAERMGELLEGKGSVIVLRYQEGSASTMQREQGFLETLAQQFPEIEVISSNQYGGATTESAYQTAENLLTRFEQVQGIFCPNESTTFGMLRALQDSGKAGKVFFVGFDCTEKLIEALQNNEMHGLVLQNPFKMGELGVRIMMQHLNGEQVEAVIDTGVMVATPQNLQDEEIQALVKPQIAEIQSQ